MESGTVELASLVDMLFRPRVVSVVRETLQRIPRVLVSTCIQRIRSSRIVNQRHEFEFIERKKKLPIVVRVKVRNVRERS